MRAQHRSRLRGERRLPPSTALDPRLPGYFPTRDPPCSDTMLKGPARIVPQWKDLQYQLRERLELQKGLPEGTEGTPFLLSDRPSIVFRESCFPRYMPILCSYTTEEGNFFASFTWRRAKGSKVRVWSYNMEDETSVTEKQYSLHEDPVVLTIIHVPHVHLFVAYCGDINFRFFGDHTQDFKLLSKMTSPYSVTSLCYSPETCELVSGAIGVVAFWTFLTLEVPYMSVTQEIRVATGEFVHFLRVEQERRMLVALCENVIRVYDCQTKAQIRTFQVSQGVSLTCCAANWPQSILYTGDLAGDIKVWNFDTGTHVNQFKAHLSAISSMIIRASMHTLMTASLDGMLKEWNLTTCELLRRVDIGEEVFQMQFLNEQTFFLRTQYTFSIRTVNNFYQLFSRSKSILKKLVRVQCGPDKARILATTEDGIIQFLSPVTGEMLFVTWPFQLLEKALDYVYDPDREELLVTMGTTDIYVLDTTKNPCPAKYILRTTERADDKVLCLAYSRLDLEGRATSFIFSGFKSGKVRSVTQHLYRMGGRKIHDGNVVALSSLSGSGNLSYNSRESSYLCSYGLDEYIILSEVILKKNSLLEVVPLVVIPSTNCRINILLLIPGYICVLTEQNRVRLWRQAALVPGEKNPFWKETAAMHSSTITSFDYCHTLSILVTGGSDGSVRIWDILGKMLVEFDTTLKFSRVCFANQRGDLMVGCNMNVYFISCVTYLPRKHLTVLLTCSVRDDVVEYPLPFLPRFLLTFDVVFVPKYRQVGKQAKKYERLEPITNRKEVVIEKNVAKVVEFIGKGTSIPPGPNFYEPPSLPLKEMPPEFAVEYQLLPQPSLRPSLEKKLVPPPPYRGLPRLVEHVPLLQTLCFREGHSWPIAPDGYIPNSVIRAQLFPKGTPADLWCPLLSSRDPLPKRKMVKIQMQEWDKSEVVQKAWKKKAQKTRETPSATKRHQDLLAEIVTKPWLRHKPSDTSLPGVMKAILNLMDDVPYSTYLLCTSALVQISESYTLPTSIQEVAFERLIQDTNHKEVRMRLAAWEALGKMDLLTEQEVAPLARALLDENKKVRDLARFLLDSVAGITDKFVLKKEMQRLARASLGDLTELSRKEKDAFPRRVRVAGIVAESKDEAVYALTEGAERLMACVENHLTANLFLMTECPPPEAQLVGYPPPSRRRRISEKLLEEYREPEGPAAPQARWLGLFDQSPKKGAEAKQPAQQKLPRIQQARGKGLAILQPTEAIFPESSSSSSSSSSSRPSQGTTSSSASPAVSSISSGSTWRSKRDLRRKPKVPAMPSQEARRLRKVREQPQPLLLQRRNTRTQLYTEMLKSSKSRKEQAAATPEEAKAVSSLVQAKLSQPEPPALAPAASAKGSLIDPNQQYAADKSKWRSDLYKLMMLRIAPVVEGCTAAEDFLASARVALAGRTLSWEALTHLGKALLGSQESGAETSSWRKYMGDLLKASLRESWLQSSVESLETVVAVRTATESPSGSETDLLSPDLGQEEGGEQEGEGEEAEEGRAEEEEEAEKERRPRRPRRPAARAGRVPREASEKEMRQMAKWAEQWAARMDELAKREEQDLVATTFGTQERELPRSRERLPARGKEGGPARSGKEWEHPRGKVREPGRPRELEVAAERREKEAAQRKGGRRTGKEEERALLTDSEQALAAQLSEDTLASVRAEGKAWMLRELKARALVEAKQAALEEAKERALAEARQIALAEARKKALAEAWEKAEVHQTALAEVMQRALEEARERVRAEGLEGEMAEERVRELAWAIAEELAKEGAEELALLASVEPDEARVLELAEEEALEIDEARAEELAEAAMLEVPEERIAELAEVRAQLLAQAKLMEKELELEEENWAERRRAFFLGKEARGSLEALEEEEEDDSFCLLSEDEREALVATWEMDLAPEPEASLADRAQLLLEVLTKPEKLQGKDSSTFQQLFRVVSLLWVPSTTAIQDVADALLEKAEELLREAEERQESLSKEELSMFAHLKEAVTAHKPWSASPKQFAVQMKKLLKSTLTVLRARNLQRRLAGIAWRQVWQQKAEKEWRQDEVQGPGRRAWLSRKFRQAFGKAQAEQERPRQEQYEQQRRERCLKFRSRPIVLGFPEGAGQKERGKEGGLDKKVEEEEWEKEEGGEGRGEGRKFAGKEKARRDGGKLTWSMGQRWEKAWHAILQMEEDLTQALAAPRPKQYRLPKDSLYKTTRPTLRLHRRLLRRGGRQHIFRLDEGKGVDWEKFMELYQSLVSMKEEGMEPAAWQEQASKLLDLYDVRNPLIRTMIQQLLVGDRHQSKYVTSNRLKLKAAQAHLGQRILYEMIVHSARLQPPQPSFHHVIPLSYQNNVHPLKVQGVAHFGPLYLKWKTFFSKGKLPKLSLYVYSHPLAFSSRNRC
ncbi:WD repeat-containing protein 87 [Candoia aspera]|uniref:WD repeat-containing protein 87 n=1 Tax=Candoia aspera TaxID=51853 RepID=UPI002FD7ECCA